MLITSLDTGEDKKDFCLKLGAEKWIDFKETKDIVQEVVDVTDGLGAHAAIVAAASVNISIIVSGLSLNLSLVECIRDCGFVSAEERLPHGRWSSPSFTSLCAYFTCRSEGRRF